MSFRLISYVAGAVLIAALTGWVWGRSGKSEIEEARRSAVQQENLTDARALILEGQIHIFQLNFGDATKRYEAARAAIERVQLALRETGQAERAGRLEIPLTHLKDAQRLAVSLDASARNAADEALKALAAFATS